MMALEEKHMKLFYKDLQTENKSNVIRRLFECCEDYTPDHEGKVNIPEAHKSRYDFSVNDSSFYYVQDARKYNLPKEKVGEKEVETFFSILNISEVDTSNQVVFANMKKEIMDRQSAATVDGVRVDEDVNTGPSKSARILIDPFRNIVLVPYSFGIDSGMINNLLKKVLDVDPITSSYILDLDSIDDINDMIDVKSLEYRISIRDRAEVFSDAGRSENGDIAAARALSSDDYTIKFKAPTKAKALEKAKGMLNLKGVDIKKMVVIGDSLEGQEKIDILKRKKLVEFDISYQHGESIEDSKYMEATAQQYKNQYNEFEITVSLEDIENAKREGEKK